MTNPILTTTTNSQRNELLCQPYASIDIEYRKNEGNLQKPYAIFLASLFDSLGITKVKHVSDFANYSQPEKELVKWLMSEMLNYRLTIGWYSKGVRVKKENGTYSGKDSDLKIIDDACKFYDIPSIIAFNRIGVPYVRGYSHSLCNANSYYAGQNKFDWYYHIDLSNIYKKQMIKNIYQKKYNNLKLDTVSKAVLKEGKFEGLDGQQIQSLSKEKQLQYVCQDAVLAMKLSKHNNYEIFDLMNAISRITGVSFDRVCHTEISSWWGQIIDTKIHNNECGRSTLSEEERKKQKSEEFEGGKVLDPKVGYYKDNQIVYVYDVRSLYPTMMILHNISFETVNCSCCKDNPEAKVSDDILHLISEKEGKRKIYWICKKHLGIIPRLLLQYRNERFKHKDLGNNAMQLGLKILINGCYGLFGSKKFEHADYRIAELTTAFGRQILLQMKHTAEEVYGFNVIYGDTDSIFVTDIKSGLDINKFLAECYIVLEEDVEIEVVKVYAKFALVGKKHYIGIHSDKSKEPDIVGLEGKKSDRPVFINNLQKDFADDIKYERNPTIKLKQAYRNLEKGQVPSEQLAIHHTLGRNPSEYSPNAYQRIVGMQQNAKEGDPIKYYKSYTPGKAHSNPDFIDWGKYLEMLESTFEKQLKVLGYDFSKDVKGVISLDDFWQ